MTKLAMFTSHMVAQMAKTFKLFLARLACLLILICARECCDAEMFFIDVLLQGGMLSEDSVAARIASASKLLIVFVCLKVTLEAGGSGEGFVTTFVITDMVFLLCMGAFDVMTEVRLTKESLVARCE